MAQHAWNMQCPSPRSHPHGVISAFVSGEAKPRMILAETVRLGGYPGFAQGWMIQGYRSRRHGLDDLGLRHGE